MSNAPYPPPPVNEGPNAHQPEPGVGYNPPPGPVYPPGGQNYPGPYPPPTQPYDYRSYYSGPGLTTEVVGFWPRALALILDSIIVGIPSGIFYGLLNLAFHPFWNDWGNWPGPQYPFGWSSSIIFWGLYAWLCYRGLNGNTLGKSVLGIKLINPDGSKPSLGTFLLHYTIGYWINGLVLCLGYIWAVFDTNRQTWGQKIFKDFTVRGNW